MKYLLIGIDGCQKELFYRFEMPFMQGLIEKSECLTLEEDLLSRGWTEICTGQHARENNAYYERPVMSGNHDWTYKYSLIDEVGKNNQVSTLWDDLNKKGYSVGIMNVPTTPRAPKVNGFFVAGGGGGQTVEQGISEIQCYPNNIASSLNNEGYILDERVPSLIQEKKLINDEDFFKALKEMTKKRVDCYILLNKKYNVDFGFLAFRSFAVIEFIAAAEISRYLNNDDNVNKKIISVIKDYYIFFDAEVKRLCESLGAHRIALVSDHGMVPHKYGVDLNLLLQELGLQYKNKTGSKMISLMRWCKNISPQWIKNKAKKIDVVKNQYRSLTSFDKSKSKAFSLFLGSSFLGVYINDQERFGGQIGKTEIEKYCAEIVKKINESEVAVQHGLKAVVTNKTGKYGFYMPDVNVIVPDGYAPFFNRNQVVEEVLISKKPVYLKDVKQDIWTGTKSKEPLSILINHKNNYRDYNGNNLTVIYKIVMEELG